MNPYDETKKYILQLSHVCEWPQLYELVAELADRRPHHWCLPLIICEAVSGNSKTAIPGMAAIACLHSSLALVDDMLDDDPKGAYHIVGVGEAANYALALQATGLDALSTTTQPIERQVAMIHAYTQVAATTAFGQYLDAQGIENEEQYWQIVQRKSGPFFGLAFALGAWLGGASVELAEKLHRLGCCYGEIVQLHDDLSDCMVTPASPDWILGRATLPILYAQLVPHIEQQQFIALRTTISQPWALAEAQAILLRSGAVSYTVEQILHKYQEAQQLFATICITNRQPIDDLMSGVIRPVSELLILAGVDTDEARQIMHPA